MIILVDVDETLTPSEPTYEKVALELGIPWKSGSYEWFTAKDIGVNQATMTNMFRKAQSREHFMDQEPYPYAQECLDKIGDEDWAEIWYISSRHSQTQRVLQEWISKHQFPQSDNVLALKDKLPWITKHSPEIVIDDKVGTLWHSSLLGAECFSLKHPWNCNLSNQIPTIHLCKDWQEIELEMEHFLLGE